MSHLIADYFKIWLEKIFYSHVGHHSILLLDSWSDHCNRVVEETMSCRENRK